MGIGQNEPRQDKKEGYGLVSKVGHKNGNYCTRQVVVENYHYQGSEKPEGCERWDARPHVEEPVMQTADPRLSYAMLQS